MPQLTPAQSGRIGVKRDWRFADIFPSIVRLSFRMSLKISLLSSPLERGASVGRRRSFFAPQKYVEMFWALLKCPYSRDFSILDFFLCRFFFGLSKEIFLLCLLLKGKPEHKKKKKKKSTALWWCAWEKKGNLLRSSLATAPCAVSKCSLWGKENNLISIWISSSATRIIVQLCSCNCFRSEIMLFIVVWGCTWRAA